MYCFAPEKVKPFTDKSKRLYFVRQLLAGANSVSSFCYKTVFYNIQKPRLKSWFSVSYVLENLNSTIELVGDIQVVVFIEPESRREPEVPRGVSE